MNEGQTHWSTCWKEHEECFREVLFRLINHIAQRPFTKEGLSEEAKEMLKHYRGKTETIPILKKKSKKKQST